MDITPIAARLRVIANSVNALRELGEAPLETAEIGVLPEALAERLVAMAKFRNVLVHLYLEIEVERLYQYLQHNLGDFDEFAQHVANYLARVTGLDEDATR